MTRLAAQLTPMIGPVASSRRAVRRPGAWATNVRVICSAVPNSAMAAWAAPVGVRPVARWCCQVSASPSASSSTVSGGRVRERTARWSSISAGGRPWPLSQQCGDGGGEFVPGAAVGVQPAKPGGGEVVGAASAAVHCGPGAGDQPGGLQPVQRRVDGAGGQVEPAVAAFAQCLFDRVPVPGPVLQSGQQQHVEVALEGLRLRVHMVHPTHPIGRYATVPVIGSKPSYRAGSGWRRGWRSRHTVW